MNLPDSSCIGIIDNIDRTFVIAAYYNTFPGIDEHTDWNYNMIL